MPQSAPPAAGRPYLRATVAAVVLAALWLGWAWLWTDGRSSVLFEPRPREAPRTLGGLARFLNVLLLFVLGVTVRGTAGRSLANAYLAPLVAAAFGFATWWPIHAKGGSPPGVGYLVAGIAALIAGVAAVMANNALRGGAVDTGVRNEPASSATA